eukprot:CAMPEP_0118640878 /NCGR_PEP_ID=MMETSP0785-20121206/4982_1 /TAXON_ID=91992 /ORGANISM="Bolidomonas pacifica, Strain CCMP 1866" /LENGTH=45 /DNA_ID= /DNA_START= /DNA_END= /DNA_ORIENTATION=
MPMKMELFSATILNRRDLSIAENVPVFSTVLFKSSKCLNISSTTT